MKIKEGVDICTTDFWYDLTEGGYIKPEEILERDTDIIKVQEAVEVLRDFYYSCESQIEDFVQ